MRKIGLLLLTLVFLLTTVPMTVAADVEDDYIYDFIDDTVYIEMYLGFDADVVVPDAIEGCPVTVIGEYAFSYCDVETVVLPDTVTHIEGFAFDSCTELQEITLSENLQVLGENAFDSCKKLTSVVIPNGVTELGEMCFNNCRSLQEVILPAGLTTIGDWAFYNCQALTTLTIPASVTSIGAWAFDDCTALESVYFEGDAAKIVIGEENPCLTEATWYHANPVVSGGQTSISPEVDGLAFLFDVAGVGGQQADGYAYVNGSARVTPYTDGVSYPLVKMGAVVSNREGAAPELSAVDGVQTIAIEGAYLWELGVESLSYAVRIIHILEGGKDTAVTARPYYVYEKDGREIVVYGTPVSQTYNAALNG